MVKVSATCFPSNLFQSADAKNPSVVVSACEILIAGVVPPEDDIGAVPVTDVTPLPPPEPLETAVTIPEEFTVILLLVYEPGVTPP